MIRIDRDRWGAEHGRGAIALAPKSLVLAHHTVAPNLACGIPLAEEIAAIQAIERFHAIENGWVGIGYNWLFTQSGHVFEGRGWDRAGAHAGSRALNGTSVGMCFVIDGSKHSPTRAAMAAFREVIQEGLDTNRIDPAYVLKGHRDVKATECPGDVIYRVLQELRP